MPEAYCMAFIALLLAAHMVMRGQNRRRERKEKNERERRKKYPVS